MPFCFSVGWSMEYHLLLNNLLIVLALPFRICGCINMHVQLKPFFLTCYSLLVHFCCQICFNCFIYLVALVAVLEVGDGVFEVLSTSGDTHLGGDDFDKVGQIYSVDCSNNLFKTLYFWFC